VYDNSRRDAYYFEYVRRPYAMNGEARKVYMPAQSRLHTADFRYFPLRGKPRRTQAM